MTLSIPSCVIPAGELLQHISRVEYAATPLYFGTSSANRYDDPTGDYGVLYLGFDLPTVLMESVFHQHQWHRSRSRTITLSEIRGRIVRAVGVVERLNLADMTAPGVMAREFGLNLGQLASRRYIHTQRISRQIYEALDSSGDQPSTVCSILRGIISPRHASLSSTGHERKSWWSTISRWRNTSTGPLS